MIPISRLVAVSLSPASSVLSRTLARTGRVLRLETARLTTDRPRARFSCMTESFTSGSLHTRRRVGPRVAAGRPAVGSPRAGPAVRDRAWSGRGYLPSIFSSRHHRSNGVDSVDGHARRRRTSGGGRPSADPVDGSGRDRGRPADGPWTSRRAAPAGPRGSRLGSSTRPAADPGRRSPRMSTHGSGFSTDFALLSTDAGSGAAVAMRPACVRARRRAEPAQSA